MGINAELVEILGRLRDAGQLENFGSVVELGAQDVSAPAETLQMVMRSHGVDADTETLKTADGLYAPFGFSRYVAIDATGAAGALVFDLNKVVSEAYGYAESFDLVTNLGTSEHVFNQHAVFANAHELCRVGGIMIHCLPAQGLVNHGFYNYHPRFVADLAAANGYEMLSVGFTRDFKPRLFEYTLENFRAHDDGDLMVYSVLRKVSDQPFRTPFDSIFRSISQLPSYKEEGSTGWSTPREEFNAYIKTTWTNATAASGASDTGPDVDAGDPALHGIPTEALERELLRRRAS